MNRTTVALVLVAALLGTASVASASSDGSADIEVIAVDASASPATIRRVDLGTGETTAGKALPGYVSALTIDADATIGTYLSDTGDVAIVDLTSGSVEHIGLPIDPNDVAISADGSMIAATGIARNDGMSTLVAYDPTTGEYTRLSAVGGDATLHDPALTADGRHVAAAAYARGIYSDGSDGHSLFSIPTDASHGPVRRAASPTMNEVWWSSATELSYTTADTSVTVSTDGGETRQVSPTHDGASVPLTDVTVSPDAEFFLAAGKDHTGWTIRADGAVSSTVDLSAAAGMDIAAWLAPATGAAGATDVDGSYHADSIETVVERDWMRLCEPYRFCPDAPTTRKDMAVALANSLGLADPGADEVSFSDVHDDDPYAPAIRAIAAAGVTSGCDTDRFCPDAVVTRAQMATFVHTAYALPDSADRNTFTDVNDDHVHVAGVEAAEDAGITTGCADGRFCPNEPIARGQMAAFLLRATT